MHIILNRKYWIFESIAQFKSLLAEDAKEVIEGNSSMKTDDLLALMEHIGIENMVFEGGDYGRGFIEVIDTIFIRKDKLDVKVFEFIDKYKPDESDPCGSYDKFDGSENYWRFWWD